MRRWRIYPMALLEARGLGLRLPLRRAGAPDLTVLRDIDFHVDEGECVAIVGESGSGKTSLLRTLARLYEPTAGTLQFEGRDISHLDQTALRACRTRMPFIFQDSLSALNPRHCVERILRQPGMVQAVSQSLENAAQLLMRVGLDTEILRRYPHELSGGQRQRVGIARALALAPKLIFADEILSGQDARTRVEIRRLLLAQLPSTALVMVSHDLVAVAKLCSRVYVLRSGQFVEHGLVREVLGAPRHPYTQALLTAAPSLRDYLPTFKNGIGAPA